MTEERISEGVLKGFVRACLEQVGFTGARADVVANVVVEADLRGVDSHGTRIFTNQARHLLTGAIDPSAEPELVVERGGTALFDGHHGYGVYLCVKVIEKAVALAEEHGIGMVTIKSSSHWGCPAYYPRWMAKRGFIGIGITNTNPAMPLWGSSEKSIGNNPLTIGAPRLGKEPLVLDIAMQQIAWGRIGMAQEAEERLPGVWGFDRDGNPTDDPGEIRESGRVRPMGDHKGSGLAVMLEILTGVISSGLICYEIGEQTAAGHPANYVQSFIAVRVDNFTSRKHYFDRVEAFYQKAKSAPAAAGFTGVSLPGDRSNACMEERRKHGIPIAPFREGAEKLARQCGIPVPWGA